MIRHKLLIFLCLLLAIAVVAWSSGDALAQGQGPKPKPGKPITKDDQAKYLGKPVPSEQKAAATAARARGVKPGKAGTGLAAAAPLPPPEGPGGIPHYFGPYGNWAFSPLPTGTLNTVVTVDAPGSGYSDTPIVTVTDAYDGTILNSGTATVAGGSITAITLPPGLAGYTAPVVTITDATGTGAAATATFDMTTLAGGLPKFVDKLPGLGPTGANLLGQYIPVGVPTDCTYSGQVADCYSIGLVEYAEQMHTNLPPTRLRGYVQVYPKGTTPQPAGSVNLTTQLGVTFSDGSTVYGYDKPHYLGPVLVAQGRAVGVASPAGDPKPVRITFYNLLPSGTGGDLFLPVDETVAGAGLGPALPGTAGSKFTQNRATIHLHGNNTVWISDGNTHQWITPATESTPYPAGVSARNVPDMGTGCDAIVANPPTGLPGDPATQKSSGCQTFFYTNAQSARLQFYHDHAFGITRLNVYAGEAAGYVLTDAVEKDLINGTNKSGVNIPKVAIPDPNKPGDYLSVLPGLGIPLIIQDKTFVDANTIYAQDPTWNWGTAGSGLANTGDLWYPHVYMVATNPYDVTGVNPFGKWFYGPWFNPPTPVCVNGQPAGCIEVGLVPNEYYQPDCGLTPPGPSCTQPWEAPLRPGVPNPSIAGETFMDTPLVNGTAYPYFEVPAGPVRFRVLNANNDRGINLQLYQGFDKANFHFGAGATDPSTATTTCTAGSEINCTEVKMVPVSVNPANQFADTPSGIPDPVTAGPPWIQIGTEGGFMPAPVVVPQQPIGFNMNTGQFNFGIVNQHSLYLQPAERADVIVDFTGKAGQTFILYNDCPAPIPAGAAVYDFYTGNGDQTGSGGAPNTLPGYGPNTRTIMQIRVTGATVTSDYSLTNLQAAFAKTTGKRGVFEVSQDPIVIPQAAYQTAYNPPTPFPTDSSQFVLNVGDFSKTFQPLQYSNGTWSQNPNPVTIPFEMKAMHDEMGGVYDTGFGRMSGMLGLTNPALPGMIPFPYSSPPTDLVMGSLEATPIGSFADGTQLWRIFHNGVDTHPIHTHLFTAQLINRVGQDGQVADATLPVDPSDMGWKDTFKVNPLEITFLALRPTVPTVSQLPFEVPNSVRLIDPSLPEGATLPPPGPAGWFDPATNTIPEILNHYVNFGWEYVWHCHILSHEEMDFMHSLVAAMPPRAPTGLTAAWNGNANSPKIILNWTDNALYEVGFTIQRALDLNFTNGLVTLATIPAAPGSGTTVTYTDSTPAKNSAYYYRVLANGAVVGDASMANFPTMSADSMVATQTATKTYATTTPPAAPTTLTATPQTGPQVSLTWQDNATNETGFSIERCSGTLNYCKLAANYAQIGIAPEKNNTGKTSFVDTTVAWGKVYYYRVAAFNGAGSSYAPVQPALPGALGVAATLPAIPAAPTSFTISVVKANGNNYTATLNWGPTTWPNPQPTSFTIQRANNLDFTTGLSMQTVSGTLRATTQTISRNTTYYYRIRANNSLGGSSAWTNALPFPIRTGP